MAEPTRRDFLGRALAGGAAATCACMGWGAIRYLLPPPSLVRLGPVDVASHDDLLAKGHLLVPFRGGAALVIVDAGRVRAVNPRCTHLGCAVEWRPGEKKFFCPCHGGIFDGDGRAVSGPPKAPLAPLPAFVRNRRVYVGE